MLGKASEENAAYKKESAVTAISQNDGYVEVITEKEKYNTRFVIATDVQQE